MDRSICLMPFIWRRIIRSMKRDYSSITAYRGNRTVKAHADGFAAFTSPNYPPLMEAGINIRNLNTPPAAAEHRTFHAA